MSSKKKTIQEELPKKEDSPVIDQSKYSHVPAKGSWEIPRKLFHYSIGKFQVLDRSFNLLKLIFKTGFVVLYLYRKGFDTKDVYPPLIYLLCFIGSCELLRFNFEWFNQAYCYVVGPLMRPTEVKTRINGVIYYLLGKLCVCHISFIHPLTLNPNSKQAALLYYITSLGI